MAVVLGDPVEAVETQHEGRGRVRIDEPELRPDHGHASQRRGGLAGPGIDDVVAALVGARGRDGPVRDGHHGRHGARVIRVTDADPPGPTGCRVPADDDVAARVDAVVRDVRIIEDPCRLLDRPALDVGRRIETAWGRLTSRIERAMAGHREVVARGQHMADVRAGVGVIEVSTGKSPDLAVLAVGAEPGVDVPKVREDLVDLAIGRAVAAHLDADGGPHHRFDPGGRHQNPAWSRAACRLWAYASLV